MMTGCVVSLLVAAVMASFSIGLYLGERGRRRSAERWAVTGTPNQLKAVSMAPSEEAEDRLAESTKEYSKETVDRGVKQLMADAKSAKITVNEADLRRDVESMLSGEDVLGT